MRGHFKMLPHFFKHTYSRIYYFVVYWPKNVLFGLFSVVLINFKVLIFVFYFKTK